MKVFLTISAYLYVVSVIYICVYIVKKGRRRRGEEVDEEDKKMRKEKDYKKEISMQNINGFIKFL